jgi:hypothetical protein
MKHLEQTLSPKKAKDAEPLHNAFQQVEEASARLLQKAEAQQLAAQATQAITVGSRVEAQYQDGSWYKGTVVRLPDERGRYVVQCDTDEKGTLTNSRNLRLLEDTQIVRKTDQKGAVYGIWSVQQCGVLGEESSGVKGVLTEQVHSNPVLFLGRSKWNSVSTAVDALNAGALKSEGGMCIIFSKKGSAYYFIWRSDKSAEAMHLLTSMKKERAEDPADGPYAVVGEIVDIKPQAKMVEGPWCVSQCWLIDNHGRVLEEVVKTADEVLLVGKGSFGSASEAVNALNTGALVANAGFCVIFSNSSNAYYLLWRKDQQSIQFLLSFHHESHMRRQKTSMASQSLEKILKEAPILPTTMPLSTLPTTTTTTQPPPTTTTSRGNFKRLEVSLSGNYHLMHEAIQVQLFKKLGLSEQTVAQRLQQPGGRNLGVWVLQDRQTGRIVIAKLVAGEFNEGDQFARIANELPNILGDPTLAFPMAIVQEKRPNGVKAVDLVVMNPAPGTSLAEAIGTLWYSGQQQKVMQIIEKTGAQLAQFHKRYGNRQHCDFQPSNVFYDARTDAITFIDLADIGGRTVSNDVQHFMESMRIISKAYGPQFSQSAQSAFQAGYSRGR